MHNRFAARFIFSALEVREWTELRLSQHSGIARSVISAHLSGVRRIQPAHLVKYMAILNHRERPALLIAWLRDYMGPELAQEFTNNAGNDLSPEIKRCVLPLDDDNKLMLGWWAHEMSRDGELLELFRLLSTKAGYRPKRTVAGPVKRSRRGR